MLLSNQKVAASFTMVSFNATQGAFYWKKAYEDSYVSNKYYLEVYDLNMVRIYKKEITSSPYILNGYVWTFLQSDFGEGVYYFITTIPEGSDIDTGPYYSSFVTLVPDNL